MPQHRERILIAGFDPAGTGVAAAPFSFDEIEYPPQRPVLASILHPQNGAEPADEKYTSGPKAEVRSKYTLSDPLWEYLQAYAAKHRAAGNGFRYGLVTPDDVARTLSARYYKDGSEILISQGKRRNPRRLTPRECARLMGFPDTFEISVSDTQAYRQFGNSVIVPMIREVARLIARRIVSENPREKPPRR